MRIIRRLIAAVLAFAAGVCLTAGAAKAAETDGTTEGYYHLAAFTELYGEPERYARIGMTLEEGFVWAEAWTGDSLLVLLLGEDGQLYEGYVTGREAREADETEVRAYLWEKEKGAVIWNGLELAPVAFATVSQLHTSGGMTYQTPADDGAPNVQEAAPAEEGRPEQEDAAEAANENETDAPAANTADEQHEAEAPAEEDAGAEDGAKGMTPSEPEPVTDAPEAGEEAAQELSEAQRKLLPRILTQPQNAVMEPGGTAIFSVSVSEGNAIQWQYSADGGETWLSFVNGSDCRGADSDRLIFFPSPATRGRLVRCEVKNRFGAAVSDTVRILVQGEPLLLSQPEELALKEDESGEMYISALNAEGFLWQVSRDGGESWDDLTAEDGLEGFDTPALAIPGRTELNGLMFRCAAVNEKTVYSDPAFLTVRERVWVITEQPRDAEVTEGDEAVFSIAMEDSEGCTFRWEYSKDGGETWARLNNASFWKGMDTDTLTFEAQKKYDGLLFRCAVDCKKTVLLSGSARLIFKEKPPVILAQPLYTPVRAGETVVLTVTAENAGKYQWEYSKDGGETWADLTNASFWQGNRTDTLTFEITSKQDQVMIRCRVTGRGGECHTDAVTLTLLEE